MLVNMRCRDIKTLMHSTLLKVQTGFAQLFWIVVLYYLLHLSLHIPYVLAVLLLGIYPKYSQSSKREQVQETHYSVRQWGVEDNLISISGKQTDTLLSFFAVVKSSGLMYR